MDLGHRPNALGALLSSVAFRSHFLLAVSLVVVRWSLLRISIAPFMEIETLGDAVNSEGAVVGVKRR